MADNTVLNTGTGGDTISTDDIGAGVKVQRVKVQYGVDGSATDVSATAPLPVQDTALTGSGSLTAQDQAVTLALGGTKANVAFQVSGTWVGTLTFEASLDNFATAASTIVALRVSDLTSSTTATNNGIYRCTTAGLSQVRLRMSAYTSGTAVIAANATEQTSTVLAQGPAPDYIASGSLTAVSQSVTMAVPGATSGYVQLAGTWDGSVVFEGSLDNFATSTTLSTTQSGGRAPSTTALTANGFYRVLGVTNHAQIRARCSVYTSGTISVTLRATAANGIQPVISTNAAGFLGTFTTDLTTPGKTNQVALPLASDGASLDDLVRLMLIELRVLNVIMANEFRVREDLASLRNDPSINTLQ